MLGRFLAARVLLLGFLLLPRYAMSQTPPDTLSASLMRRLAEAADGYRTGSPVFVAAQREPPHDVRGVFPSRDAANRAAEAAGPGYRAFGPYVTPVERGFAPVATVQDILVIVRVRGGLDTIRVNPLTTDALFWSPPALDKFCIDHYEHFMMPARVAVIRDSLLASLGSRGFLEHWLWTLCTPPPASGR